MAYATTAYADASYTGFLFRYDREAYRANERFQRWVAGKIADEFGRGKIQPFCDVGEISSRSINRDFFDIYKHRRLPIYFIQFKSSVYQDLAMDRMVTFSDTGTLGDPTRHDLPRDDGMNVGAGRLTDFYNRMRAGNFALTAFEQRLRDALLLSGEIARSTSGEVSASREFVIVSSSLDSRAGTAEHEFSHAIYLTDPKYRIGIDHLYEELTDDEKKVVQNVLFKVGGHTLQNGQDVFYTEFGAYLRDPQTLYGQYVNSMNFTSEIRKVINSAATKIRKFEDSISICGENAVRTSNSAKPIVQ